METRPTRTRLGRRSRVSGILFASAVAPLAVVPAEFRGTGTWVEWSSVAFSACLLLASVLIARRLRAARVLATLGVLGVLGLGSGALFCEPLASLATSVVTLSALAGLWGLLPTLPGSTRLRNQPVWSNRASGAALAGVALWTCWPSAELAENPAARWAVGWALAVSAVAGILWAFAGMRERRWVAVALLLLGVLCGGVALNAALEGRWAPAPLGINALFVLLAAEVSRRTSAHGSTLDLVLGHPERSFVGTFAVLCVLGTALLALPISAASGSGIPVVDAVFTATSAVCVTGLVVVDTPTAFSTFGQATILGLIQLGGLGVMSFYTFVAWALQKRLSLKHEAAVTRMLTPQGRGSAVRAVKQVFVITALVETLGGLVLTSAFSRHGDPLGLALWRGFFTSVSAFCNAGFALQSDSLVPYREDAFVLHVTSWLIVLGGLSPLAIVAVPDLVRRSARPVSAQARLCLAATGFLLVSGLVLYAAFEWNASLRGLSIVDKLHNAWFQSATLRTAGFNSVDIAQVRPPTLTLMLAWMFVGGNPGSTAGGVKTTTVALLVLTVVQSIRGRSGIDVFRRRIPVQSASKAVTVATVALLTGACALLAMQLTQNMPTRLAVFEVVSALGTVGLTVGGTPLLDGVGKAIIITCMFVGRVGGLTFLSFLSTRNSEVPLRWPEEEVDVG